MPFTPTSIPQSTELEARARQVAHLKGLHFKKFLGKGAFKECFLVVDTSGRPLALKLIKPGCSRDRLEREVDAMSACSHPHIATLHEMSSVVLDGTSQELMIEELLQGGSLQDELSRQGTIAVTQCLDIGDKLIGALAHIAAHHIVHRDIKPANIMFRKGMETPVLVDFGLVRNLGETSLTQSWQLHGPGTPIFAPPEQLNNDKNLIDWRSDQFSLGVTLACAVFGEHPFCNPGDTDFDIVERVARRESLPGDFVKKARAAKLGVLETMMAAWPVNRFRTPKDLQVAWARNREST